jgi:putative flippase GtrA
VKGLVRRWAVFNGVGAIGIAVQLVTLAVLVRRLDVHYLLATALAVEITILHNFFWHDRWTWRDRPAASGRDLVARLGRFHVLNGAVSLVGNLVIARALTGGLGVDPIASNIAAIVTCSIVNFLASETLVFRTASVLLAVSVLAAPSAAAADAVSADLKPATIKAWDAYAQKIGARHDAVTAAASPFFVLDLATKQDWRTRARQGEVVMQRIDPPDVPDGKLHHWAGAVFVPGLTVAQVLARLSAQAGQESQHYKDVTASRVLLRDGDHLRVFMRLKRESIITVQYNTEHDVLYRRLGSSRAAMRSLSTKIAEIADAGTPREREKPIGQDNGFLWRLNAYWRYEQVDGGVLIECESISLSRGIPVLARWLVTGTVERLARESLEETLRSLKLALSRS